VRAAIVSHALSDANRALALRGFGTAPVEVLTPREALLGLVRGDAALVRLDVSADLAGVEEGLWVVDRLHDAGVLILNRPAALLAAHDKLLTSRLLRRAALPHPRTILLQRHAPAPDLDFPVVVKPRFGSWGRDVILCRDRAELERALEGLSFRPWFRRTGALAQELIPPLGYDLRLLVARGRIVGCARRIAAAGEWRTNVSLGAQIVGQLPPPLASRLALEAAEALGLDLVGVDLLPTGPNGFCVIELNGAVDFRPVYSFPGRNAYTDAMDALSEALQPAAQDVALGAAAS
jgi:[lysine-biosynthesis-protein LysW]--L-2-aminoadipate ligase